MLLIIVVLTENARNIGGVVMMIAGGWIVWSFLRQPDRQAESVEV